MSAKELDRIVRFLAKDFQMLQRQREEEAAAEKAAKSKSRNRRRPRKGSSKHSKSKEDSRADHIIMTIPASG